MGSSSEIVRLSAIISSRTAEIDDYLKAENLPEPSLNVDAPPAMPLPPHLVQAKLEIMVAMDDLKALLQGPAEILPEITNPRLNILPALDACLEFRIAQSFKVGEEITYKELSKRCGLEENDLRRIVRMLISMRIFEEPHKNVVRHNGCSKLIHESAQWSNMLAFGTQAIWSSSIYMNDALKKWPGSQELDQTAFYLRRKNNFWDLLKQDEVEARRFKAAMDFIRSSPMSSTSHLVDGLGWDESSCPKLMVDVGGHDGTVGADIVRRYPTIQYIVQDLPEVTAIARAPEDVKDQLTFQAHDFFQPETVQADVYLLKSILHDWPDKYARKIVSNLIPVLKPGAKVILNECCLLSPGQLPSYIQSHILGWDLCMKQFFNSKERSIEEWVALFQSCDERFRLVREVLPPGSAMSIIEFEWV